jgi:hypothetical protein
MHKIPVVFTFERLRPILAALLKNITGPIEPKR